MSIFSNVWQDIKGFFSDAEKDAVAFLDALASSIVKHGGAELMQAAADAVTVAETTGGTGAQKFAAAKSSVIADLTSKGIPILFNAVHAAIEAAVAQMQAIKADNPVTVA